MLNLDNGWNKINYAALAKLGISIYQDSRSCLIDGAIKVKNYLINQGYNKYKWKTLSPQY